MAGWKNYNALGCLDGYQLGRKGSTCYRAQLTGKMRKYTGWRKSILVGRTGLGLLFCRFIPFTTSQGEIDAPRISSLCFANPGICPEPPKSSDQGPPSSPHSMSVNHSLSCPKYGQWSPRSRLHRKTFVQTRKT